MICLIDMSGTSVEVVQKAEKCRPLHPFGLEINWTKTKIQTTVNDPSVPSGVMETGNAIEIVEKFTYLGTW